MRNDNYIPNPENQREQDIVTLATDIYEHTSVSDLSTLNENDKNHLKIRFDSIFLSLSGSGENLDGKGYHAGNGISELIDKDFYEPLKNEISEEGWKILQGFIKDLSKIYQKIETNIEPNSVTYSYALAAVLMNVGTLSQNPNTQYMGASTGFNLKKSSMVQEKIKDILRFTTE